MSAINPLRWNQAVWRRFFVVAAGWNLLGGVPAALFPNLNLRLFYGFQSQDFHMLYLNRGFWLAVVLFGVGYLMASRDPQRHIGILWMGVLGKIGVAVGWLALYSEGKATLLARMSAWGDLAFTVFFILYLAHGQHQTAVARFRRGESYESLAGPEAL